MEDELIAAFHKIGLFRPASIHGYRSGSLDEGINL